LTTSLTAITIRNYKNLHVAGGLALGKLNIFIGPNGSGKSNLMGMLQFLQQGVAEGGANQF
jgi:AAA15 family ATPase/GTPase